MGIYCVKAERQRFLRNISILFSVIRWCVSHPGWRQIHLVAKDDLELPNQLPHLPRTRIKIPSTAVTFSVGTARGENKHSSN